MCLIILCSLILVLWSYSSVPMTTFPPLNFQDVSFNNTCCFNGVLLFWIFCFFLMNCTTFSILLFFPTKGHNGWLLFFFSFSNDFPPENEPTYSVCFFHASQLSFASTEVFPKNIFFLFPRPSHRHRNNNETRRQRIPCFNARSYRTDTCISEKFPVCIGKDILLVL